MATRPPHIALVRTAAWDRLSDAQRTLVESTRQQLAAAGATVTVVELPAAFNAAWSIAQTLCDAEGAVVNGLLAQEIPPRISQPSLDLVARGKALVSALFGQPSGNMSAFANSPFFSNFNTAAQGRLYPIQGALPITRNNQTLGAMGCSGASAQQDEDAVRAALAGF